MEPGVILPGSPQLSADRPFRLRLLHFNDLHGRLADVTSDAISPVFSRIAGYIRRAKASCLGRTDTGVLALSGGDDLVGSPFAELAGCRPDDFDCHPAFRLYSAAGVDAAAVGNHDLDWGLSMLALAARRDASFPLLSANLIPAAGSAASNLFPAGLFVVNGVRVGIIGLTTPAEIKHVTPGELTVTDPVAAVRHWLPILRPCCDVLIVLSHLGYSLADPAAVTAVAGDVELATALPHGAVDLIVGAHTHSVLNAAGLTPASWVNGIPIVQAGARGCYLGEVAIDITQRGATVTDAWLHRLDALDEDAAWDAAHVLPLAERVQRTLREPVGRLALSPGADFKRVMADMMAARCRAAGFPVDFALVDASSVAAELPAQALLTFGDLFRVAPYADSIVLYRLMPAQFQEFLADNVRRFDPEGKPAAADEERGFVSFSQEVSYRIAPGSDDGRPRPVDVTIAGRGLADELADRAEPYLVACSSFVRQLACAWERRVTAEGALLCDLHALPVGQTSLSLRAELVAYVRELSDEN